MRVLTAYLSRGFWVTFCLTVAVFTFVMTIGSVIRAIDLLARGVAGGLIFQFFVLSVPFVLQFTVPMATLTAALLLFTRLSLDGEITAMKACGLSLWGIVAPVLFAAAALSAASFWLGGTLSPRCRHLQRGIVARLADADPLALIEEGQFVRDFPGYRIYVGERDGHVVRDIVIYQIADHGVTASIRARSGRIEADRESRLLRIELTDARIDQADPESGDPTRVRSVTAARYPKEIDLSEMMRSGRTTKRLSDMTNRELRAEIRALDAVAHAGGEMEDLRRQRTALGVEWSIRMAMSLGCFGCTMLGIPLGIRSRRKESSAGVILSLGIMFVFYFFMIIARSLTSSPEWLPDQMVWIPLWIAQILGVILIHRAN